MPLEEDVTPKAVHEILDDEPTPDGQRALRVLMLKRDGCPNCEATLAAAKAIPSPDYLLATTNVDDIRDVLRAGVHGGPNNAMLEKALTKGRVLPLLVRVSPWNTVAVHSGPLDARQLDAFIHGALSGR
jgi:hypothetical protein